MKLESLTLVSALLIITIEQALVRPGVPLPPASECLEIASSRTAGPIP